MSALRERDIRSALDFAYDAGSMMSPDPFPREGLERLAQLIPVDAIVGYRDELVADFPYRIVELVELPKDPVPPSVQEAALPLCHQDPLRNGTRPRERRALKLSDFLTRRQMRKLGFYHEVWKPLGIDDSLRVWLPAPEGHGRQLYLERSKRDFTERERSLLELVRPALIKMHAAATTRRRKDGPESSPLTPRETEILGWIADGKTTREIAAILVVSPHTVRKHIEHILEKLDVRTRSAAVAQAFPRTAPGRDSDRPQSSTPGSRPWSLRQIV
jgi:DNA-binding CsgD family transcriptional regulator